MIQFTPPDGERKKPLPGRLILCALFHIPAAVLRNQDRRCYFAYSMQDRRPTEGAAMLVRPIFQKHNFLKKDCPHHGSGTDKKMYYTV